MTPGLTVCVLGFDRHAAPLGRCLDSLYAHLPSPAVAEVRVGLNRPAPELAERAERTLFPEGGPPPAPARILSSPRGQERAPKYPMMRRLFWEEPPGTEYVLWMDDDSWFRADAPPDVLARILERVTIGRVDLAGANYRARLRPGQADWVRAQPWYRGVEPIANEAGYAPFFQGAWWVARVDALRAIDYPWPALDHNGGDVMLGVAARQQGWRTAVLGREYAHINADDLGRESRGPRRGLDTRPIGALA